MARTATRPQTPPHAPRRAFAAEWHPPAAAGARESHARRTRHGGPVLRMLAAEVAAGVGAPTLALQPSTDYCD